MGKRICGALLCLCFLLALACSGWRLQPAGGTKEGREYARIVMTYQYMEHSSPDHLEEVLAAVNEISQSRIGVEVAFKPVNALDSFTDYPVWLSKGEPIDLMLLNYQNIRNYVDKGMLLPLDGLLERFGPEIEAISRTERNLYGGTTVDGGVYGCEICNYSYGGGGGLWISRDVLTELSFPYEKEHIYSMDELDILFARLKQQYPDSYPLGQITAENSFTTFNYFRPVMTVGGDVVSGVLGEGERVCDLYETDQYYEFLCYLREWYLKGYIYPEAAYTDASGMELLQAGILMSFPSGSQPGLVSEDSLADAVCLRTTAVTYGNDSSNTGTFWTIPSTAGEPEAAMKFLNLMYSDARIVNLLRYGIEGKDYVLVDDGVIAPVRDGEGKHYRSDLGVWGNMTLAWQIEGNDNRREQEEYAKSAVRVGQEYDGFYFDTSDVGLYTARVQEVLRTYLPVLESGSIPLEVNYGQFVSALKEAGVDRLVEEKQRQLDAWLARRG